MRKTLAAAFMLSLATATAAASPMSAALSLSKAEALQKKGAMALFSSDVGLLKGEVKRAGLALRKQQEGDRRAGRQGTVCLPEKAAVTPDELLGHLRAIPQAQRGMSFQAAFTALMKKKYPCR